MSISAQAVLETFAPNQTLHWRIVNDGVMGGISSSQINWKLLPHQG